MSDPTNDRPILTDEEYKQLHYPQILNHLLYNELGQVIYLTHCNRFAKYGDLISSSLQYFADEMQDMAMQQTEDVELDMQIIDAIKKIARVDPTLRDETLEVVSRARVEIKKLLSVLPKVDFGKMDKVVGGILRGEGSAEERVRKALGVIEPELEEWEKEAFTFSESIGSLADEAHLLNWRYTLIFAPQDRIEDYRFAYEDEKKETAEHTYKGNLGEREDVIRRGLARREERRARKLAWIVEAAAKEELDDVEVVMMEDATVKLGRMGLFEE